MTTTKRSVTVPEIIILSLTIIVLIAVLSPVIAVGTQTSALATCQANLRKLGGAFRMYLADWDRTYPTNRKVTYTGVPIDALPVKEAPLPMATDPSPYYQDPRTGKFSRITCYNGSLYANWVGSLFDYVGPILTGQSTTTSIWKCPAATMVARSVVINWKARAEVTYVMNFNLLEQPEGDSRHDSRLMLLREQDKLVNSVCRGCTSSGSYVVDSGTIPLNPFLTAVDSAWGSTDPTNAKLHGFGSNILFADGHVKLIPAGAFSNGSGYQAVWDGTRWVNAGSPQGIVSVTR